MQNLLKVTITLLAFFSVSALAGPSMSKIAAKNPGKSLAVVSVSANNWSNSLQGWNSANTSNLMGTRLNTMLEKLETRMSEDWKIIPASSFVEKKEYQALAGEEREVGLPSINGVNMPLFSKNRKQLIKSRLDKDVAQNLAKITGADFLMVVYSEWAVATGRFIPTSKSLAKNVVSIYNAQGTQVYKGRKDQLGNKSLGAMGRVAVNENTIDEWVIAYEKGVSALYNQGRKKKK